MFCEASRTGVTVPALGEAEVSEQLLAIGGSLSLVVYTVLPAVAVVVGTGVSVSGDIPDASCCEILS